MAKLMSKKTKEIVQTTTVLVLVAAFVFFYIIYPLNVIDDFTARENPDLYNEYDFEYTHEITFYTDLGFAPDSFTVTSNDNLLLAALYFEPDTLVFDSILGTVILIHPEHSDRTYFKDYVTPLLDSGLAVVLYDQRASGQSGGVYYSGGVFEAEDLIEVISTINIRDHLIRPLTVVGIEIGADAAIYASQDEDRIDRIIAVSPYITTTNWLETSRKKDNSWELPLANMTYFWWYKKASSFPYDRTGVDDIKPVTISMTLIIPESEADSPEISGFKKTDSEGLVSSETMPSTPDDVKNRILNLILN